MIKIAENIKRLRKSKGWTQHELALHIEMSQKTITAYETGSKKPSIEKLVVLAAVFDVTIEQLLGIEEPQIVEDIPMIHKNSRVYQMQGYYEKLSPEEQRNILKQVKALADKSNK